MSSLTRQTQSLLGLKRASGQHDASSVPGQKLALKRLALQKLQCSSSARGIFYSLGDVVSSHTRMDRSPFNSPSRSCNTLTGASISVAFRTERPDCGHACIYFLGTARQFAKTAHTHITRYICIIYMWNKHLGICWLLARALELIHGSPVVRCHPACPCP